MPGILDGKVAIVTGGGRGIGRGVSLALAEAGAKVVVNDLGGAVDGTGASKGPADDVVKEIKAKGGTAIPNYDSVATMQGGEKIVKTAVDSFGRLDIVVTPAGILRDRMVFNMSEEEWDAVIAVHLKGTFSVVKNACILMRQQRSGRIITFASESGIVGNSGQANYGAAKSGIAGFTKVVARDMGRYGVTVNCITPRAATRMTATVPEASREIRAQRGVAPLSQPAAPVTVNNPEDIAPMVVFLASDEAANINGQIFLVYGGTVGLYSLPRPIKTIWKDGRWTIAELRAIVPKTLTVGLKNPAPAQPPAQ